MTLSEIRERFGARVAQLVECVTENPELPTPERKRAYREGLRHSPDAARAICAADKVCNASDLYQAASQGDEQVLARFAGGLDAQVKRLSAELHDARRVGDRPQPARCDARRARRAAHPGAPARGQPAPAPPPPQLLAARPIVTREHARAIGDQTPLAQAREAAARATEGDQRELVRMQGQAEAASVPSRSRPSISH